MKRALADGAGIDDVGSNLDFPPLVLAADHGLVKMVKLFVRRGANLDVAVPRDVPYNLNDGRTVYQVVSGTTALHQVVNKRKLDVVRLLLRSGGNP